MPLVLLHATVGVTLLAAVGVLSRIFGMVWYYLMLWMWGVAAVMAIAIGWTAAAVVARVLPAARWQRARTLSTAMLTLLTAAFAFRLSVAATTAVHWSNLGDVVPALAAATADALDHGVRYARGRDARYLVYWSDTLHGGAQGFALLNELERRGFRVGVPPSYRAYVGEHRVLDARDAAAAIVFANGAFIDRYRAMPAAVEVASVDPRSPEERREYDTLRATVISELKTANVPSATIRQVETNLFGASLLPGIPATTQLRMGRLLRLGTASAVFILPPHFQPPFVP